MKFTLFFALFAAACAQVEDTTAVANVTEPAVTANFTEVANVTEILNSTETFTDGLPGNSTDDAITASLSGFALFITWLLH